MDGSGYFPQPLMDGSTDPDQDMERALVSLLPPHRGMGGLGYHPHRGNIPADSAQAAERRQLFADGSDPCNAAQ